MSPGGFPNSQCSTHILNIRRKQSDQEAGNQNEGHGQALGHIVHLAAAGSIQYFCGAENIQYLCVSNLMSYTQHMNAHSIIVKHPICRLASFFMDMLASALWLIQTQ